MYALVRIFSFIGKVVTVSQLASSLSIEMGRPIHVAKKLIPSLVFVGPTGESARKLLGDVAFALHASVRESADGYYVERTPADLRSLQKTRAVVVAGWIRQGIEKMSKFRREKNQGVSFDIAYFNALARQREQMNAFFQGKRKSVEPWFPEYVLPSAALLEAVVERVGVTRCAEVPSGHLCVYQDNPIGDDLALPPCQDLIDRFCRQMASGSLATVTPENQKLIDGFRGKDVVSQWRDAQSVSKLRLRIITSASSIGFLLDGFNLQGRNILTANFGAGPMYGFTGEIGAWTEFGADARIHPAILSEESQHVVGFLRDEKSQKLPQWYLHPEQQEPLSFFVQEALCGLAAAKPGKTLVVAVEDSLWSSSYQSATQDSLDLEKFVKLIQAWVPYDCVARDGSIVLRSIDTEYEESIRADRKVVGHFARALAASGRVDLPSAARFLFEASPTLSGLAGTWLLRGQTAAGADPAISAGYGEEMLRALGPISDTNWNNLLSGQTLSVGELGIESGLKKVLDSNNFIVLQCPPALADWKRFCWELMPRGIPAESTVSLSRSSKRLIKVWDKKPARALIVPEDSLVNTFDIQNIRIDSSRLEPKIIGDKAAFEKLYADRQFRYCELPKLEIRIGLPENAELHDKISECMKNDSEVFGLGEFSPEVRDRIWKTICDRSLDGLKMIKERIRLQGNGSPSTPPSAPPRIIPPK